MNGILIIKNEHSNEYHHVKVTIKEHLMLISKL
jgi:hypothetical protein